MEAERKLTARRQPKKVQLLLTSVEAGTARIACKRC
jgi:hypothetical protein